MLRPRPFVGAFQHALRSRWSPIAPSSRIDHRLAAFELAEKDFARRLTALTLTFIFKQALTKSLALFALLKIFCYLCGSKTEIFNIWLTKQ